MHFVTLLGGLWQIFCDGWLWDVGVGVAGGGVAVWLALLLDSGACCGISHNRGEFSLVVIMGCCSGVGSIALGVLVLMLGRLC